MVDGYFESVEETEGWIPGTETLFEDASGKASLVLDLHYGSEPVPLLRFYEDYYREYLQDRVKRQEQIWGQRPGEAAEEQEREAFAQLAASTSPPGRDRRESEAGYFLRIQRWREDLGLPEEVFVRIVDPEGEPRVLSDKMWPGLLQGKNPPGKIRGSAITSQGPVRRLPQSPAGQREAASSPQQAVVT